jgi:hypothetical protein
MGSLANRGTSIDEGVGQMQNRSILLNLARASRGEPLYFVSIGSVAAQGQTDLRLGAPAFTEGPTLLGMAGYAAKQVVSGGTSTFLDNTTNTNFQMGVFNTQAFYEGLMTPLGLDEIDLLLKQGFSREMIFYLVIDKAKITPQNGQPYFLYNDPTNPSYPKFVLAIESAMEHGLTTEIVSDQSDAGAIAAGGAPAPGAAAKATSTIDAESSGGPSNGTLGKAGDIQFVLKAEPGKTTGQTCYEQALATPGAMAEFALLAKLRGPINFCGGNKRASGSQYVSLNGDLVQIQVEFRSIYGIFNYLGNVIDHPDAPVMLVDYHVPSETTPVGPLLTVVAPNGVFGGCFTAVSYGGKGYCVPQEGADNTKKIFNVLNALVALKQSPGDLPTSQTVLINP